MFAYVKNRNHGYFIHLSQSSREIAMGETSTQFRYLGRTLFDTVEKDT